MLGLVDPPQRPVGLPRAYCRALDSLIALTININNIDSHVILKSGGPCLSSNRASGGCTWGRRWESMWGPVLSAPGTKLLVAHPLVFSIQCLFLITAGPTSPWILSLASLLRHCCGPILEDGSLYPPAQITLCQGDSRGHAFPRVLSIWPLQRCDVRPGPTVHLPVLKALLLSHRQHRQPLRVPSPAQWPIRAAQPRAGFLSMLLCLPKPGHLE